MQGAVNKRKATLAKKKAAKVEEPVPAVKKKAPRMSEDTVSGVTQEGNGGVAE
jgi:hypothetical protein